MIKTFTGPMHSGKTEKLIDVYNSIFNKEHILCFKPVIDIREPGIITSKSYKKGITCISIDAFDDILKYLKDDTRTIFIDEVQLLNGNVNILTYLSIVFDMDIYLSGLNLTSDQKPFNTMPNVLAISDEIEIVKSSCFDCGREASYTYYNGNKNNDILVGDKDYLPLCSRCLVKRNGKDNLKKLLKNI